MEQLNSSLVSNYGIAANINISDGVVGSSSSSSSISSSSSGSSSSSSSSVSSNSSSSNISSRTCLFPDVCTAVIIVPIYRNL